MMTLSELKREIREGASEYKTEKKGKNVEIDNALRHLFELLPLNSNRKEVLIKATLLS